MHAPCDRSGSVCDTWLWWPAVRAAAAGAQLEQAEAVLRAAGLDLGAVREGVRAKRAKKDKKDKQKRKHKHKHKDQ